REHHQIEFPADTQSLATDATPVPERLERPSLLTQQPAELELPPVGRARPARQPLDVDQRLELAAAADRSLHVELKGGYMPALSPARRLRARQLDVLQTVKELEAPPTSLQYLVERGEYDVSHARLHAPEERTAIGEERADHCAHCLPGGDGG